MKRRSLALALLLGQPQAWADEGGRSGQVALAGLQAPVAVRYDGRGVPHIQAQHETDLYVALGYVHGQDRLFQMELLRRLAQGEAAEVLGPRLVESDRLFRTLGLREQAAVYAAREDRDAPAWRAVQAYLAGLNAYQDSQPLPVEFGLLGIGKRAFTLEDTLSVSGFMAYGFAMGLRTEPLLTYVRDQLGAEYLKVFDLEWQPGGVLPLADADWRGLDQVARVSRDALAEAGLPQFEGSNAWVVAGTRTASGKPLLAGDPHVRFAVPAVWYEAHLQAPGFELYGHYHGLTPFASLGHNRDFGWSLTMFQNDDMDLVAEHVNPANAQQVRFNDQWVELTQRDYTLAVKGAEPVHFSVRQSPHGPIISDHGQPVSLWWTFLQTQQPILAGFYQVNRADTREKMRAAAELIAAPGLNILWANAAGDIGWWAAAQLPVRPAGVNPAFILDAQRGEAHKSGYLPFRANPQEENPPRGFIVSANFQPDSPTGVAIPGYYHTPDRGLQLFEQLAQGSAWDVRNSQALQLGTATGYGPRTLAPLLKDLREGVADTGQRQLIEQLAAWQGDYPLDSIAATLFTQLSFDLARLAMQDELGEAQFATLLSTRLLDGALPRLAAQADSPWWDDRTSRGTQSRAVIVRRAWQASVEHLKATLGEDPGQWQWGKAHTLTQSHPLGIANEGPHAMPGGHEVPNNLWANRGPAPWAVVNGPSTRRLVDFADASQALSILPMGQSGAAGDRHYADQAQDFIEGKYQRALLAEEAVAAGTVSTLRLVPAAKD
ncbi:penicillin acylase family protein [Pseudomonas abieticivorans]|uniref:penicillin acylase family protein n=1 Tax=Pseudomonas abieticivorans TaxID=2931382 RepID=UPI0020BF6BD1|nr:penicillin acylase family protein [Pseudomonas sp. PIA16]